MKKREAVVLQPSEEQKLRLQLAQRDYDLNIEKRCRLDAELRFQQSQIRLHQFEMGIAEAMKAEMGRQIANEQCEGQQLEQALFRVAESIRAENLWSESAAFDAATLTFSAPAGKITTKSGESIQ